MKSMEFVLQMSGLCYLVHASLEDIRRKRIDVRILAIFIAASLGIICIGRLGLLSHERLPGMIPGGILLCISKFSKEAIGMGDAIVVLWLGYLGGIWFCLNVLMIAWSFCFCVALVMFVMGRKKTIPFLPFLCMGYFLSLCTLYF